MKRMLLLAFLLLLASTVWAGGPFSLVTSQYEVDTAISSVTTTLATKATTDSVKQYLAVVYQAGAETFPDSVDVVASFDTEIVDADGCYATATSKYTAPVTGYYQVTLYANSASLAWTTLESMEFFVSVDNGGRDLGAVLDRKTVSADVTTRLSLSGTAVVYAAAGKTIHIGGGHIRSGGIAMVPGKAQCHASFRRVF